MKLVLDACTVILLAKATVLEPLSRLHQLTVSEGVHGEVLVGKSAKREDALLLELLVQQQQIDVQKAEVRLSHGLQERFGLGAGESETIALVMQTPGSMVATDNRQGRKTARVLGLTPLGSPEIILALFRSGTITAEKAMVALEALREFGWFEHALIDTCREEVEHGKSE